MQVVKEFRPLVAIMICLAAGLSRAADEVVPAENPIQAESDARPEKAAPKDKDQINEDRIQALAKRIDELIAREWKSNQVVPVSNADDAEFQRRLWLDLAGRIPRAAEARDFLEDETPDKRRRLADLLLDGPNHVTHMMHLWRTVLMPEADSNFQVRFLLPQFEQWLRLRMKQDVKYDALVREIITTPLSGRNQFQMNGEPTPFAFFQAKETKPENLAAATSRMFLGVRIECAQCHDHPFDTWKQQDFWGFATFFAGMQRQPNRPGFLAQIQELFTRKTLTIPDTSITVKATFLTGKEAEIPSGASARSTLADWITAKENPYFAKAAANRIWGHMFGIGIVDPVDDFSDSNPASHPKLLDALAEEFIASDFDIKFLFRSIAASKTYQLSSVTTTQQADVDPRLFARMPVKGMTAEQFYDSIRQAIGMHEDFAQQVNARFARNARTEFLEQFSDVQSAPTDRQTTVLQALSLMNGQIVTRATDLNSSRTLSGVAAFPLFDTRDRVEALFLATLSRRPTDDELSRFVTYVDNGGTESNSQRALADVFWVLLNSSEFSLNH